MGKKKVNKYDQNGLFIGYWDGTIPIHYGGYNKYYKGIWFYPYIFEGVEICEFPNDSYRCNLHGKNQELNFLFIRYYKRDDITSTLFFN